ncbi:NAD(P)-binding Rossmann-fold superfamily protein, partial [Striga asiatica]
MDHLEEGSTCLTSPSTLGTKTVAGDCRAAADNVHRADFSHAHAIFIRRGVIAAPEGDGALSGGFQGGEGVGDSGGGSGKVAERRLAKAEVGHLISQELNCHAKGEKQRGNYEAEKAMKMCVSQKVKSVKCEYEIGVTKYTDSYLELSLMSEFATISHVDGSR